MATVPSKATAGKYIIFLLDVGRVLSDSETQELALVGQS